MVSNLRLQVLVVDGDPGIQHLLVLILGRQGWQIATAGDGESALDLLRADLPDVLLIDLILPRRSGLEVLEWINRTNPSWLRHVIVLTGAGPHLLADLTMKVHGVSRIMRKPFDIADLVSSVESCAQTLSAGEFPIELRASGIRT